MRLPRWLTFWRREPKPRYTMGNHRRAEARAIEPLNEQIAYSTDMPRFVDNSDTTRCVRVPEGIAADPHGTRYILHRTDEFRAELVREIENAK